MPVSNRSILAISALLASLALPSVARTESAAPAVPPPATLLEETLALTRPDGSVVHGMVSRPRAGARMPILLAIDGSVCIPSRLNEWTGRLSPEKSVLGPYALLTVEKPEPTQPEADAGGGFSIGPDFRCSDTFKRYYTIEQRVVDHLLAIRHLRRHANWWDGRLFLWGFSDGARIAGRVGSFTPETRRMVVGGFGGGLSMASELADFHVCPAERTPDRETCLRDLRAQLAEIRDHPTPLRTWNGDSNTYAAWASRLDAIEANVLEGVGFPVLVFHGSADSSVPVDSARLLARRLAVAGVDHVYREIEGMGHGLGSRLPPGRGEELQRDFLRWLLAAPSP